MAFELEYPVFCMQLSAINGERCLLECTSTCYVELSVYRKMCIQEKHTIGDKPPHTTVITTFQPKLRSTYLRLIVAGVIE